MFSSHLYRYAGEGNGIAKIVKLGFQPDGTTNAGDERASIRGFARNPVFIDVDAEAETDVECLVTNGVGGSVKTSVRLPPKSEVSALTKSSGNLGPGEIVAIVLLFLILILVVVVVLIFRRRRNLAAGERERFAINCCGCCSIDWVKENLTPAGRKEKKRRKEEARHQPPAKETIGGYGSGNNGFVPTDQGELME